MHPSCKVQTVGSNLSCVPSAQHTDAVFPPAPPPLNDEHPAWTDRVRSPIRTLHQDHNRCQADETQRGTWTGSAVTAVHATGNLGESGGAGATNVLQQASSANPAASLLVA